MPSQLGTSKISSEAHEIKSRPSQATVILPHTIERAHSATVPRLLVSVRSVDEATAAIAGSAEILDVKEPTTGSLGMATVKEISEIAEWIEAKGHAVPLSVALGELADWSHQSSVPCLPDAVSFAKLGLNHCSSWPDWRKEWRQVRSQFDQQRKTPLKWVAVAYADAQEARAPDIAEVLAAAIETNCAGFLIDTWTKDGRSLLDEIDLNSLQSISGTCKKAGLFLALAGRLNQTQLAKLRQIDVDIIAIRSAACIESDRTSRIAQERVQAFHSELHRVWQAADSDSNDG